MKFIYWTGTILNIVVVIFLIIYSTIVHLPYVAPNPPNLPIGNIPYYDINASPFPNLANRFTGFDFWLYVSDFLRWIVPFGLNAAIGAALLYSSPYVEVYTGSLVVLFIIEVLKIITRVIEWSDCDNVQICRPEDSTPTGAFGPTNMIFEWTVWFNVAFLGVLVIYIFIATEIMEGRVDFYKELAKDGIVVIYDESGGESAKNMNSVLVENFWKFANRAKEYTHKQLGRSLKMK